MIAREFLQTKNQASHVLGLGVSPSPSTQRAAHSTLDLVPKLPSEVLSGIVVIIAAC